MKPPLCFKLPQPLLAHVLHMLHAPGTHQHVRLVCRRFREAFDSGVTSVRTRPGLAALGPLPLVHVPLMALRAVRPQRLTLHCHRLGDAGVTQLAALLRSRGCDLSGLQELHLHLTPRHYAQMDRAAVAGLEALLPALLLPPGASGAQRCSPFASPPLRVLDLSYSYISLQGAHQLAAVLLGATQLSTLQSLDLSGCRGMGAQWAAHLAVALRGASHLVGLREVSLHGLGGHKYHTDRAPSAEKVTAWQTAIGALAATLLGSTFPQLRSLDLSETHLGDAGLAHMAATLQASAVRPAQLQRLVLRRNAITSNGLHHLVGLLQSWSPAPSALPAAAGPVPVPGPSQPVRLRELDLSHNSDVQDAGICHLSGLARAPGGALAELRALVLAHTGMGTAGAQALASALEWPHGLPQLRVLELSGNHIGDKGVRRVAAALHSAWRSTAAPLLELGLDGSEVTHAGASELSALLRGEAGAGLQRLALQGNILEFSGMRDAVAALCSRCSGAGAVSSNKLHRPGLCGGTTGNDAASQLASGLHSSGTSSGLQSLDVELPDSFGEEVVRQLVAAPCGSVQPLLMEGLRELRLSWLRNEAVMHLAAALEGATHLYALRTLELDQVFGEDEAMLRLAAALAGARHLSGLQRLSLTDYNVTRAGALGVVERVCGAVHLAGLRQLELKVSTMDEPCLAAIARVLGTATHLVHLQRLVVGYPDPPVIPELKDARPLVAALRANRSLCSLEEVMLGWAAWLSA